MKGNNVERRLFQQPDNVIMTKNRDRNRHRKNLQNKHKTDAAVERTEQRLSQARASTEEKTIEEGNFTL